MHGGLEEYTDMSGKTARSGYELLKRIESPSYEDSWTNYTLLGDTFRFCDTKEPRVNLHIGGEFERDTYDSLKLALGLVAKVGWKYYEHESLRDNVSVGRDKEPG